MTKDQREAWIQFAAAALGKLDDPYAAAGHAIGNHMLAEWCAEEADALLVQYKRRFVAKRPVARLEKGKP